MSAKGRVSGEACAKAGVSGEAGAKRGASGGAKAGGEAGASGMRQRLDRWLWCTRFYKTRGLAAEAVKAGHVRINGQRIKPAHDVREGDVLDIAKGRLEFEVRVDRLPVRRGSAPEAQTCYTETPQSVDRRQAEAEQRRRTPSVTPPTAGRPGKRTRRLLREKQRDSS